MTSIFYTSHIHVHTSYIEFFFSDTYNYMKMSSVVLPSTYVPNDVQSLQCTLQVKSLQNVSWKSLFPELIARNAE